MIGLIAGEIIGSPYAQNNIKSINDIFFPLFEPSVKGYYIHKRSSATIDSLDQIDQREQRNYKYRETQYKPCPGKITESACEAASEFIQGFNYATDESRITEPLTASVICGMAIPDKGDALDYSTNLALTSSGNRLGFPDVQAMASIAWMAYHGHSKDEIIKEARSFNLELDNMNLLSQSVKNVITEEGPSYGMPIVAAALAAVIHSASWEESVRRAVALGGNASLVAALAGAIAEALYRDIPEHIAFRCKEFIEEDQINIIERFERQLSKDNQELRIQDEQKPDRFIEFHVLTQDGQTPQYIIHDKDIEKAVRSMREKQNLPYINIAPEYAQYQIANAELTKQSITGTYIEEPRLEKRRLFYDRKTKSIYSISTVPSPNLPSIEKRSTDALQFRRLAEYAEHVRSELEAKVGHDSRNGHIHFSNAFYPVVGKESVELWQGDILRARMGIGPDGLLKVDTNVHTGSLIGEYLEGALNSAELARRSMGVAEFKALLDQYCLDYGFIPDEKERQILHDEGMDADIIKKAYTYNIDRALNDLAQSADIRLDSQTMFCEEDLRKVESQQSLDARQKAEREGRVYAGSAEDAIWSKSHPGAIFTIGHSNMSGEEMILLLRRFGIEAVVDIRSYPQSSYTPQFNGKTQKSPFSSLCSSHGIEYEWFGDIFGGHIYSDSAKKHLMKYEEVMATDRAKENLKMLRDAARSGTRIALMCSEASPSSCHRFAMMGYALEHPSDGRIKPTEVQHILRNGQLVSQQKLERSMMKAMGMSDGKGSLKEAMAKKSETLQNKKTEDNPIRLRRNSQPKKLKR